MSLTKKLKNNKIIKDVILDDDREITFINTGCAVLNLLFSGKLNGGIPRGLISQIASPSQHGKSFVALKIAKNAQKLGMTVIMIDTERAFDYNFSDSVGVDREELIVIQENQLEAAQSQILSLVEDLSKEERNNLLIIIDSWASMYTSKTMEDSTSGADKKDMTISIKRNSFARVILGLGCTVFVCNQVADTFNQYDPIAPIGARGIYFSSHCIVMATSKARDKEGDEISGAVITAKTLKSRLAVEHSKLKFVIKHESGIHPTLGLEDDLLEFGYMFKPASGWYSRDFEKLGLEGEDKKWRMKEIQDNWQEFYKPILTNKDVLLDFEKKYSFKHNEMIKVDDMLEDVL